MDDRPHTDVDEQPPASPAEALAIIKREQARQEPDIAPFFVVWGVVWMVIGLAWSGAGFGVWPDTAAGIATAAVIVLSMIASGVLGARLGRGVAGPTQHFGAMYGWAWTLSMIGTGVLVGALARLGGPGVGVLAPALFVFVVGAMYTLGGAFWRSRLDYGLGLALQVIAVVSAFTPLPWNSLLMGLGGGGAMIATGVLRRVRR
ncbi:hypothetical protein Ae168Ps1_4818c [Pseudonocardia sp. Ae168_Ps1]|uniref:hypothetical protein n=1 Tax=unclassified Pseudonocardia TaxID=2619320 RepID=UPI00094B24AC|nr:MULTISPECIES: hypothetical protein [unclassified Pseudonocardia]OLL76402.1 hypothetical protein Ae150APs1_4780c [Pseudonocardia sp. Ae150A_Ps1]OLL82412.1 hypothetical protein Ae168Ps1_4818c [Pseudonocardia sp. Ae168_Ps1]OLL83473.1 hypothetical protein Ae263Ps1_0528 [Pseudonocardia sp. Ae263_Ps1]OLL90487.1 hypothetical protein Ae356Ps1_0384c [Pseudonocardia sp. Ae356_Ps1]